ncbi:MAG TPA: phospholipase D family protein [Planctomycetota bacterium]|nr:phospholipase D family protein [Planctomycetota bacterium]
MTRTFVSACLALSLMACDRLDTAFKPAPATSTPSGWEVRFSPKGGCTEAVVEALRGAKSSVLVQAYSFTSAPIAAALVEAHRRGVKVQVLLDKSQRGEKYSSADFVAHAGIPTSIDDKHAIAHNKVLVIDGTTVITGSFNFTKAAEERNAENLLVIQDAVLADKYSANWRVHAQHSESYAGRGAEPGAPLLKPLPEGADDK